MSNRASRRMRRAGGPDLHSVEPVDVPSTPVPLGMADGPKNGESGTHTVAVANDWKIQLVTIDELGGKRCVLFSFGNRELNQWFTPILLTDGLDNFVKSVKQASDDLVADVIEAARAAGLPTEKHLCSGCGTRIFGARIEVGTCLACEKAGLEQ